MDKSRLINLIVIHCSATPNGDGLFRGTPGKPGFLTPVDVINNGHAKRGFKRDVAALAKMNPRLKSIGYHFVIYTNGTVATGRGLDEPGAHAKGFNLNSIGICMVGASQYSAQQWHALRELVEWLLRTYPKARVCGHRDLSPDKDGDGTVEPHEWLKTCPGFDVRQWGKRGMEPLLENIFKEVGDAT